MEKRPGRGADQFILRLPEGMRDAIREQAEQSGRSMNAEIIARLEFASQHTPEEIDKLKREIATLEKDVLALEIDFHDQVEEIEGLKRDKTELKQLMNHFRDLQERLMYHVLNYIDEIPAELSIWAFDMAQIVGSPRKDLDVSDFSESEARETIRARRDAFRKRALESVKDFLASRDDDGAEKA